MSFVGYRCWDPDEVNRVAPIDVGSIEHEVDQDASIFLATHQSLQLIRTATTGVLEGEVVGEDMLLADFQRAIGNDPEIIIITGAVGTGKSHMVKWLHANCALRSEWHQVYIEKRNTNLRRVIETILAGLHGPRVTELRAQLQVASSAIRNLEEAKSSVITNLAHFVAFPSRGSADDADPYEGEARAQLPHLLNDPVLRLHLLRDGGAIHRITRLGLEGLPADDDERDLFFHEEDLPLQPSDLVDASAPGRKAVELLGRSERLRSAAIDVLNEELAAAKVAVFIGSGVDLIGLFDEVRRELAQRGVDLVLYIEDLVLLHGIDRELTQVFTEGRGPGQERCGMRVAIAVTEGYLSSGFNTLTSRATHYSLNLNLDEHVPPDVARSFVGRYLNAIRTGTHGLSRALAASRDGTDWVPNHCTTCEYQESCHQAFGADHDGHGLYPLNATAIRRLVPLADTRTAGVRFDPREVLRHVVRDPLALAADELPAGRFPSGRFTAIVDPNRRSVAVSLRAELARVSDGDRYMALTAYWAPGREPIEDVVNLDPVLHMAFALPPYKGAAEAEGVDDDDSRKRPEPRIKVSTSPSIDAWANNERRLPSPDALAIRRWILRAVVEQVRSSGLPVRNTARGGFRVGHVPVDLTTVRIEDAPGGGAEVARIFEIEIGRSAANAVLMKGIVTAEREGRWAAADAETYARLTGFVDQWAQELAQVAAKPNVDLGPAVELLAVTSPPTKGSASNAGALLEHALQARVDPEPRSPSLRAWSTAAVAARREALQAIGGSLGGAKGDGAVSFVDGAAIERPLSRASSTRRIGDLLTGSDKMVQLQRTLRDTQAKAEASLRTEVDALVASLAADIGPSDQWEVIRSSVEKAINRAHDQGLLPVADARERLAELAAEVPEDAIPTLRRLARSGDGAGRDLWTMLPDPVPGLQALDRYRCWVDEVFTGLETRLAQDLDDASHKVGAGATATSFRMLADALEGLVGGESR